MITRTLLAVLSLLVLLAVSAAAVAEPPAVAPVEPPEVARLVALMERASPSARAGTPQDGQAYPGWTETPAERASRYRAIARAAWDVTGEPGAKLLFAGAQARLQTAAAILAVAMHESGFAKDVDIGPCYRMTKATAGRCDAGRAHCMMQIQLTHRGRTPRGYKGSELFADRAKCFGEGLAQLVGSQSSCATLGAKDRFSSYASGSCKRDIPAAEQLARDVDAWASRVVASAK